MPESRTTKLSPIINLSAKMNARTNNEVLDVDPNATGLELVYVQNGDLFFTKALASREGIQDLGGGIVNASGTPASLFNTEDNLPSGTVSDWNTNYGAGVYFDYLGTIIIPSSNANIFRGDLTIRGVTTNPSGSTLSEDVLVSMKLFKLDQTNYPALGVSAMSGIASVPPTNIFHSIALSGNYNIPPYPRYNPPTSVASFIPPDPYAETKTVRANLGAYNIQSGATYYTAEQTFDWEFDAPFLLRSGTVYFLQHWINSANTGTNSNRVYETKFNYSSSNDISPNTMLGEEFFYVGAPSNQTNAVRPIKPSGQKAWVNQDIQSYVSPNYMLVDNPTAYFNQNSPLVSGSFISSPVYPNRVIGGTGAFNGTLSAPSVPTNNVEFGQVITIPSGVHTIYGAYFYANTFSGNTASTGTTTFYTRNKAVINPSGYNAGYFGNLSTIDSVGGTISGNNYTIAARTVLANFSGNYVFNNPVNQFNGLVNAPSNNLEKIYVLYNNPITLNLSSGTDFLLSFGWYDYNTGGQNTDYATTYLTPYNYFISPFKIGVENFNTYSGTFVYNWKNDGQEFVQANYGANTGSFYDLTCGLVSVSSGNAITSIYDYRIGDTRTQKVVFTQGPNLSAFNLYDPTNRTVYYSGGAVNDSYKWSHITFQDLLFSHQYSQTSGVCWDQIYYNPSGNSTQFHGQRPVFSGSFANLSVRPSGSVPIASGTNLKFLIATQMQSGGLRASEIFEVSGGSYTGVAGNAWQISGVASSTNQATFPFDIFHVSGVANASGQSQYNFDVNSLGTYVFATQSSGNVFFLAPLCDSSGTSIPNPLPNNNTWNAVPPYFSGTGSGVYIHDVTFSGVNTLQVPNVINYDQTYVINQINTPKFKKVLVYKNLMIGIGDPNYPSRLWFSEQQAPQIWGVDTNFYGFYDIDNDNGQELTGIEIYKDYLVIFKQNSTYTASYTGTPGNPLDIKNISVVKGNLGIFNTVATDYGVFALSQYGPVLATFYGVETIGDEIMPYYQSLDHTDLIFSTAIHDVERQQIYWSITNSNLSPDNQKGLVYSYAEKAWGTRQGAMWNCAGPVGDTDNFTLLLIGDTLGQIKILNSGDYDQDILFTDTTDVNLTKNINLGWETPWMNFGNSQSLKQLKSLRINCENSVQKLRIDVYTDQNLNTPKYTRFLNMDVPVINRVVSLAGVCRTMKLVVNSVGEPGAIKLNSIQLSFIDMGPSSNI